MIYNSILNILLKLKMMMIKHFLWKPFIDKTYHPMSTQNKLLKKILNTNKNTLYGKENKFNKINSYKEFQERIPVQSYEDIRGFIEKQENQKIPALSLSQPILYSQTSGTTRKPKYIPILDQTIVQCRRSQHMLAYAQYKDIPGIYAGMVLAIVSPSEEGRFETGTPYGSMSGLIYKSMPSYVYAKYVVPRAIFEIEDYELKYYLIAAFSLSESNITLIATANPSTLLKINSVLCERWQDLIKIVSSGNQYGLKPNPQRAEFLKQLKLNKSELTFSDLWPNLKSVTTWTGGNCAILIPGLKNLLAPETKIIEMGYLSSEFRGSITVDVLKNRAIPTIHENFFEFVERAKWESNDPEFLSIEKIEKNKKYYIFVTTQNGLYRYHINDIIEVDGKFNNTPTIRFIQKGRGVLNLTGEKLTESHVLSTMCDLKNEENITIDFFMMLGCPNSLQYSLFIESTPFPHAADLFENYLYKINIEFEQKRHSGRLKQTAVSFLKPGTAELYKKNCLENGQREGQYKILTLQYKQDCSFEFVKHIREIE